MSGKAEKPVTRLYFSDDAAPFGELNLLRADHFKNSPRDALDPAINVATRFIVRDAWGESDWLTEAVGPEQVERVKNDTDTAMFAQSATRGAIRSFHFPQQQVSWYALKPPLLNDDYFQVKEGLAQAPEAPHRTYIMPGQPIGFSSAKHDVSGNHLQKMIKRRFHPEKVYACVSDVDVRSPHQAQGIGVALMLASLIEFGDNQIPTTYVAANNERLISKLAHLTFHPSPPEPHERTNLVKGSTIQEVRLQGESVMAVRARLVTKYPWLSDWVVK